MDDVEAKLEELYRRRYVAFRNALLAVTGNREAARDAVQEGFAHAHAGLAAALSPEGAPR